MPGPDSYILALDQGTTSSRAIVFNHAGRPLGMAQQEFDQIYPQPGHVEHDPEAIWESQWSCLQRTLKQAHVTPSQIAAIGVANQRETTILWERDSGRPVANAIVWQSRVTSDLCQQWKDAGWEPLVREKTGLVLDPYFSGSKIRHLLDTIPGLRSRAERGEILFGTVDSFLMWRLSGGRVHATDVTNASRTLLWNLQGHDWDDELLRLFQIPRAMLPTVRPSSCVFGETARELFGRSIPLAGAAGDQQAATFGQACFEPGTAKNTYGTGCFLLMNLGDKPIVSQNGLLTTLGCTRSERPVYCLEGSVFIAGAVVQWLRDGLGLIGTSAEVEELAIEAPDSGGVYFVPAFVGLGAPYWDPDARGTIVGITRGTNRSHIARAAIESIAFQTRDVLDAMQRDSGIALGQLKVDGGASRNDLLMQFQSDLLGVTVRRPQVSETTALGAAYLAGLAVGYWKDESEIAGNWALDREFTPQSHSTLADERHREWQRAVARSRNWIDASR
ncbi:MAG: glycerol kinase GlpK [Planctomycetes bacterium]|nr:glycerol kinase GlpK [Planctomycetota bacterium]